MQCVDRWEYTGEVICDSGEVVMMAGQAVNAEAEQAERGGPATDPVILFSAWGSVSTRRMLGHRDRLKKVLSRYAPG